MLRLLKPESGRLCDNISRREFLHVGGLGVIGLSLPTLLHAEDARRTTQHATRNTNGFAAAKSCIIIFLPGGPSHLDTWDMKPDAPSDVRGEFKPISTPVPGVQVCEHLPKQAKLAKHFSIIRSAHHTVSNAHAAAVYTALTGENRGDATIAITKSPKDMPGIGSILTMMKPPERPILPYVSLPYITAEGAGGPPQPGIYGGIIGSQYDPFIILNNPNDPNFSVPNITLPTGVTVRRLNDRKAVLSDISKHVATLEQFYETRALDGFQQRAFSLLTSPDTRKAFDLSREPAKVRDAYGRNIYGQSGLLARRLIEAGTRMVTLHWAPDANATWDTHGSNFVSLKNRLLPELDACFSSLLNDLIERGMLDETLVVCMGEFGRTPKINNNNAGRDHWPYCYSLLVAGGGFTGGAVYGKSDEQGGYPAEDPVQPHDLIATFYHLLGIPSTTEVRDPQDRPFALVKDGRILSELIA